MKKFDSIFNLKTVMTYAVAAHKQNNEQYVNQGLASNKIIIQTHLGLLDEFRMAFVDIIPNDCEKLADKVINYYKGLTFKAMGGKINDFEQRVLSIVNSGEVTMRDIGVVASLPKAYFRSVKRDETDLTIRKLSNNSIFVGTVNSDLSGKLNILNCSFIQSLQCHVVNGEMNGNLVCFFTKHPAEYWGTSCNIKGKVKRHQRSKFHKGNETVLNYVKLVDKQ
tara:strand:- start:590 stop:1255 length:666 start_codon:yes stop_codon:yes gene_type:complete